MLCGPNWALLMEISRVGPLPLPLYIPPCNGHTIANSSLFFSALIYCRLLKIILCAVWKSKRSLFYFHVLVGHTIFRLDDCQPHENLTIPTVRNVVIQMVRIWLALLLHLLLVKKSIRIMGKDIRQKMNGPYPGTMSCILVYYYQELLHTLFYLIITHTFSSTCFVFAEGIRTYEGSKCEFYCWLQTSVGKIGHMLWNCVLKTLLCKNAPFILHTF